MSTLSVVIPAYNEEASITQVVKRILDTQPALAEIGLDLELIVVDDGSQDSTAALLAYNPAVHLVRHDVNRGYGAALKTGFGHATGDWLAFLDADGTYPPEALPELYQVADIHDADLVVGSRMGNSAGGMPVTRRLGNALFAGLVSLIANTSVTDCASGMRVIRREALPRLYPLPDGLNFYAGDEHAGAARGHPDGGSAHCLRRANGSVQAQRDSRRRALPALHHLDGATV